MKAFNTLEIQVKNDDYDYVMLNFSRFIFKNQLSEFVDFIDSKKRIDVRQHINQKQMSDFAENEKFEKFENEFDLESHDDTIFDETKTSQTSQTILFLKRNIRNRNIFDEFFARINNSWNKKFENENNQNIDFTRLIKSKKNFEFIIKTREFAIRIKKIKSAAHNIFDIFQNVMIHFDKELIFETMKKKSIITKKKKFDNWCCHHQIQK